ncbi:double zinc ribbon domain-containing protein [Kordiimonas marina]|uniref:double zinc ribbon domain-containing protein n=1 Tax=Kordiimonas marina TaxID=2872312 RepID=UPI001FF54315|nr:ComF family protein [Kordiimonas marina]
MVDFLLPPRCAACGERIHDHGHLCATCWPALSPIAQPFCEGCGLPFEHAGEAEDGMLCGACYANPPGFDWARAAVLYDDLGKKLVLTLKHGGEGAAVPVLARMMASAVAGRDAVDLILPVPLHPRRLLKRRFNQSLLLAEAVGRQAGLQVDRFSLVRRKATPSQGPLGRKARSANMAGAFAVTEKGKESLKGRHVLLIDDVMTTGATTSACARVLKRAGALSVGVLVFARVAQPVG